MPSDNAKTEEKPQIVTVTKTKTKLSKAGKSLKTLVRVLESVTVVLKRGPKSKSKRNVELNDTQDIPASEKLAFVPANASTTPARFPVIPRTNKESEGRNEGSKLNGSMNGVVGLGGTLNAVEALRSVVDRPSNVVGIIQDVANFSAGTSTRHPAEDTATTKTSGHPIDSTPSIPETTSLTSTSTAIPTTSSAAPPILTSGASSSILGVSENANAPEDQETEIETPAETDGKKKKKKKPKKKKTNPSQPIEQAVEFSPKAMEVVKRGMNTAVAMNPTSGATNSGINMLSKAMSSAVNSTSAGAGSSKITDTLMSKRKEFDTVTPIGPVAFLLKGNIDRTDLSIDASFNVKIGFITHKLGKVVGNLKTGVRIKFGLSGVLTGQARFYLPLKKVKGKGKGEKDAKEGGNGEVMKDAPAERSKWLWLDIKVTVFKEDIGPLSLPLIPLRFGHAKSPSDALSISTLTEHLLIEDTRSGSGTKRSIEITRQSITISRQSAELDGYCSTVPVGRHSVDGPSIDMWNDGANVDDAVECERGCDSDVFAVGYHS